MKIEVIDPQGSLGCAAICVVIAVCIASCSAVAICGLNDQAAELRALRLAVQQYEGTVNDGK